MAGGAKSHSLCHGATEITWGAGAPCGKNLVAVADRLVEIDGMLKIFSHGILLVPVSNSHSRYKLLL